MEIFKKNNNFIFEVEITTDFNKIIKIFAEQFMGIRKLKN